MDHTIIFRWVQRYAPEINKRMRPCLKLAGASYRNDETYIKVGRVWKYLYRALDTVLQENDEGQPPLQFESTTP